MYLYVFMRALPFQSSDRVIYPNNVLSLAVVLHESVSSMLPMLRYLCRVVVSKLQQDIRGSD